MWVQMPRTDLRLGPLRYTSGSVPNQMCLVCWIKQEKAPRCSEDCLLTPLVCYTSGDLKQGRRSDMTGQGTVWTNTQESLNSSFLLCRNFLLVPGDLDQIKGHSGRERAHKVGKWVSLAHTHLVSDEILD